MSVLAINFDLNWFLTIPGMLITGGILLLLIALIIFIATSGSGKKKKSEIKTDEPAPVADPAVANPMDMNAIPPMGMGPVAPVEPSVVSEMVNPTPVAPVVEPTPVVPEPVMPEPTVNVQPIDSAPVAPTFVPPVTEPVVEPTPAPVVPENPVPPTPEVSIYGGVSPIVPNVEQEPVERPIYGGANPMDATQAIPIIEQTPHVEYGVPVEEPKESPIPAVDIQPAPVAQEPTPSSVTAENEPANDIANIQPQPQENPVPEIASEPVAVEPAAPVDEMPIPSVTVENPISATPSVENVAPEPEAQAAVATPAPEPEVQTETAAPAPEAAPAKPAPNDEIEMLEL